MFVSIGKSFKNIELTEDEGVIYDGKVYGNSEEEIIKLNKMKERNHDKLLFLEDAVDLFEGVMNMNRSVDITLWRMLLEGILSIPDSDE